MVGMRRFGKSWLLVLLGTCGLGWAPAPGTQEEGHVSRAHYRGMLGGDRTVQMDLLDESGALSGTLWDEHEGRGFTLSGHTAREGVRILEAREGVGILEARGARDGTEGIRAESLRAIVSRSGDLLMGVWQDVGGAKELPLDLRRVATYVIEDADGGTLGYDATFFPRFVETSPAMRALNRLLASKQRLDQEAFQRATRDLPRDCIRWQKLRISVDYASEDLVSMLVEVQTQAGGLHSNIGYEALCLQWDGHRWVGIDLEDLFRRGSPFAEALSAACLEDLRRQGAAYVVRGMIELKEGFDEDGKIDEHDLRFTPITGIPEEDLQAFTLTPCGLRIALAPYLVDCFAAGSYFVTVPYAAVANLVDPQGPAGRFLDSF